MGDVSLAVDRVRPSLIKRNLNEAIVGVFYRVSRSCSEDFLR